MCVTERWAAFRLDELLLATWRVAVHSLSLIVPITVSWPIHSFIHLFIHSSDTARVHSGRLVVALLRRRKDKRRQWWWWWRWIITTAAFWSHSLSLAMDTSTTALRIQQRGSKPITRSTAIMYANNCAPVLCASCLMTVDCCCCCCYCVGWCWRTERQRYDQLTKTHVQGLLLLACNPLAVMSAVSLSLIQLSPKYRWRFFHSVFGVIFRFLLIDCLTISSGSMCSAVILFSFPTNRWCKCDSKSETKMTDRKLKERKKANGNQMVISLAAVSFEWRRGPNRLPVCSWRWPGGDRVFYCNGDCFNLRVFAKQMSAAAVVISW